MDISAFLTPPDIMSAKRVLCIQPHPDDNEIGMGGVVAALAGRGCEVHYLTVTNGDLGDQSGTMEPAELAALRREETVAAGKALGASKFYFFDEPDGSLQDIPALAGKIATLVRTIRPEVLFCPDPWAMYEAHQDHVVTGPGHRPGLYLLRSGPVSPGYGYRPLAVRRHRILLHPGTQYGGGYHRHL